MKILLIDDNPFDRELLKRGLNPLFEDIQYIEVIDDQTFEKALETLDYDLIFTDYQIKWTDGLNDQAAPLICAWYASGPGTAAG